MCLLAICMSSLKKCLFRAFSHILIWLFFWHWVVSAACVFCKLILCQLSHLLLFSPILRIVFLLQWRTERRWLRRCTEHGREELPHVWGQGQKLGGPHARGVAAKRSYPTSEVRGSGQESQAAMTQEWLKGATPCPRSGVVAQRSYPTSEVRSSSWEELPLVRCQGQWPRVPGGNSAGMAYRSYPTSGVRSGGWDEQPHIQVVAVQAQEGLE